MRQEESGLDPSDCVLDQGCELLPVFVGDGGEEVLDFNETLADENNLSDFVDAGHPRIADKLLIQCGNARGLFQISCRGSFPLQQTGRAVQLTNGVDVSHKTVARTECPIELNLLGGTRPPKLNAAVLSEPLKQPGACCSIVRGASSASVGRSERGATESE